MLTHVVMMTFADPSNAPEAKARLEALAPQIPQIASLSVALDELRTEVSADLLLITTHEDVEALREYQVHPVHQEFGGWIRPLLTARVVVDHSG